MFGKRWVGIALCVAILAYGGEQVCLAELEGAVAGSRMTIKAIPGWAQTGKFRYARWDGEVIEAVKGLLSGWPGWREPDQILAVANWYQPRNVDLVRCGELNWVWATFSNGFSLESEAPHQEQVKAFVDACHAQGIHVTAYMSIANLFPDDMLAKEPASEAWRARAKDGDPVPYGAADYSSFSRITRWMACLLHPEWRAYQRQRVDRAIDAGCDGVMWDNAMLSRCYCDRCEQAFAAWREQNGPPDELEAWRHYQRRVIGDLVTELHRHALERKPDFLMYVNCNHGIYTANRRCNAVTTEDGTEPGVRDDGTVVNNIGALRYQWAIGQGWRPVRLEYGGRLQGERFTQPMTPRSHTLGIAECAAHHVGFEVFSEGVFQRDLYYRKPEALANLDAVGRMNRFLAAHETFYVRPRSVAHVAVLADDDDRQVSACKELASRHLLFDVVFGSTLEATPLDPYRVLLAPAVRCLSDAQTALVREFVARGGTLVASGPFADHDERWRPRAHPAFEGVLPTEPGSAPHEAGRFVYLGDSMDYDAVARDMPAYGAPPLVRIEAPPTVYGNVHGQEGNSRLILHLLNYANAPQSNVRVRLTAPCAEARLFSPEADAGEGRSLDLEEDGASFTVPALDVYALVVLSPR